MIPLLLGEVGVAHPEVALGLLEEVDVGVVITTTAATTTSGQG